jgi:hypothetical protein
MRNARKKRKRQERSEKKRALIIATATKEIKSMADQQKTVADQHRNLSAKYYRMWKRIARENRCLKEQIMQKDTKYGKVNKQL